MSKFTAASLVIGVLIFAGCSAQSTEPASLPTTSETALSAISVEDRAAIEAATLDYFDGQGFADYERLDRAFADNSTMYGVMTAEDGSQTLRHWPQFQDTLRAWGSNENPPGERDGEILHIQVTDGRIATVHFRSADRFYDTLTLVKLNGDWVIAAKVFVRQ